MADYFLRKKVLVGYETAVAGLLGLTSARDSLRGVAAQLDGIDLRLPRIDVAQRYFLDYDSIAFSATPKYSYQHPIPECRVYEHGTIYRILLGTFNTACRLHVPGGRIRSPIWSARIRNGATMPGAQPGRRPRPRKNS